MEYGPPIPVNGKRPVLVVDGDWLMFEYSLCGGLGWAKDVNWQTVGNVRLKSDHPYYQSAEPDEQDDPAIDAAWAEHDREQRIAQAIELLEATGHTVTPPDPLAGDREFLAGLADVLLMATTGEILRAGQFDPEIPAAMAYLRANKGRL